MKTSKGLIAILAVTTVINVGSALATISAMRSHDDGLTLSGPSVMIAPPVDKGAGVSDAEIDSLVTKAQVLPQTGLDEAAVRRIVHDEIAANPKFVVEALNAYMTKQQADDAKKTDAKTLAAEDLITDAKGFPFLGNPDGKVEIAYYFDINCHFCKRIDGDLRRFVAENRDVKLVFREMPILTPASKTAAQIGGTLFALHPEGYAKFHDELMDRADVSTSDDIEAALKDAVGAEKAAEVITKSFDLADGGVGKDVSAHVGATLSTATTAGITGTPFIMVKGSGTMVRGAAADLYQQLTDAADTVRKTAK